MSIKTKVIVFGIGTSAKDFISNYPNDYEILALTDWDKATHGSQRYGFDIINPKDIWEYDFEKILILSTYVAEITEQLEKNLSVDKRLLIIPPKYKIKGDAKPFLNKHTHQFARDLLLYLSELAVKFDVDLILDFGTLLGLVRDGDIMELDDDIDLSVNETDKSKLEEMLHYFKRNPFQPENVEWSCRVRKDKNNNIWVYDLIFKSIIQEKLVSFYTSIGVRKYYKGHSFCMHFRTLATQEESFKKNEFISWNGYNLKAPYKYIEYLKLLYGNWMKPREYTFGTSYGTSFEGDIDEIKVDLYDDIFF